MPTPTELLDDTDLLGSIRSFARELLDSLEQLGDELSLETFQRRVGRAFASIIGLALDLKKYTPAPADEFLVPDATAPGHGQMTVSQFSTAVATSTVSIAAVGLTPNQIATLAKHITELLLLIGNFGPSVETFVRWALNIVGKVEGAVAADQLAQKLGEDVLKAVAAQSMSWEPGTPTDDAEKAATEPPQTAVPVVGALVDSLLQKIPGGERSDERTGQLVHITVMDAYVAEHPDHLVICDGRFQIKEDGVLKKRVVSRIYSNEGILIKAGADLDRLDAFSQGIRPPGRKAVRPDIADLTRMAKGIDPKDDWGWFEIKPMHDARVAYAEVKNLYLRLWNEEVVRRGFPDWRCGEGVWQPPLAFVTTNGKFIVAVTVFPGVVGYLTYDAKAAAKAAELAVMGALSSILLKKLWTAMKNALEPAEEAFAFLGVVSVVLALVVVVVFAIRGLIAVATVEVLAVLGRLLAVLVEKAATLRWNPVPI